jgi:hypothetical protein
MFFTAYLVWQLREIASIVGLTGIASEIVGESSDGVALLRFVLACRDMLETLDPLAEPTTRLPCDRETD